MEAVLNNPINSTVLEYLSGLSAHSDISESLGAAVEPLGDVNYLDHISTDFPSEGVFSMSIIFGIAVNMDEIGFRLPPEMKNRALLSGAELFHEAGSEWVKILMFRDDWPEPDLRFWARKAYQFARIER
ncbi:MAG: hypothetical protein HOD43_01730 [Candidatus Marinimicrobia bacterium]|nr:hypothetical protein [Candidatus Neomarinimicrobiota bacterium]MBT3826148.1 hypothetical protein [Candidatus Neomarinimicrobiota bacterium]MBT4294509.1 hypothetical protein [Candidatus Neomarinimicrobiota bacterium]MBT4992241.1 hypothetical protein [Candidatus Neomarinimicrobiota bacterium]MBT6002481.1 hypothetical protein [Candidatus Neomarinimicrobiota bacterium]